MNWQLFNEVPIEELEGLGFVEENDGSGDPRGTDWNIRANGYHILIDAWYDVKLARINPDTDFLDVKISSKHDLMMLIDWIKEAYDPTYPGCPDGCDKNDEDIPYCSCDWAKENFQRKR